MPFSKVGLCLPPLAEDPFSCQQHQGNRQRPLELFAGLVKQALLRAAREGRRRTVEPIDQRAAVEVLNPGVEPASGRCDSLQLLFVAPREHLPAERVPDIGGIRNRVSGDAGTSG